MSRPIAIAFAAGLAVLLACGSASAQQVVKICTPVTNTTTGITVTSCDDVSATNPLPVTGSTSVAAITPIVSSAAESGHILKASAGSLYSINTTALSATAGFVMVFNSATVPADGAVAPVLCFPIAATGAAGFLSINYNPGPPGAFGTGISVAISSTGCTTKTAIASGAWFTGAVQ